MGLSPLVITLWAPGNTGKQAPRERLIPAPAHFPGTSDAFRGLVSRPAPPESVPTIRADAALLHYHHRHRLNVAVRAPLS